MENSLPDEVQDYVCLPKNLWQDVPNSLANWFDEWTLSVTATSPPPPPPPTYPKCEYESKNI